MDDPDKEFKKDVQFYLAQARMDYGEVDKAIEVYSEILKAGEDEQAFFLRGKAYIPWKIIKMPKKTFREHWKAVKIIICISIFIRFMWITTRQ